jgi:hypothetical protein
MKTGFGPLQVRVSLRIGGGRALDPSRELLAQRVGVEEEVPDCGPNHLVRTIVRSDGLSAAPLPHRAERPARPLVTHIEVVEGFFAIAEPLLSRESSVGVAAKPTLHQASEQEGLVMFEAPPGKAAVVGEVLLSAAKDLLVDDGRYGHLDPFGPGPFDLGGSGYALARNV